MARPLNDSDIGFIAANKIITIIAFICGVFPLSIAIVANAFSETPESKSLLLIILSLYLMWISALFICAEVKHNYEINTPKMIFLSLNLFITIISPLLFLVRKA